MVDINKIESDARARRIPVMLDDGLQILIEEIKRIKPSRILEIGTAVGFSGITMLNNSGGDAVLDTIEIERDRCVEAARNFSDAGLSNRVNLYSGDCIEILPTLASRNTYDIVFIDAAKSKYLECLKLVSGAVTERGAIIADNVYFRGMVMSAEEPPRKYRALVKRLREFLEYLETSGLYDYSISERGDGVAIIRPKKSSKS